MIRQATLNDIPVIRQMAKIAFPETYKEILSKEQIDYMMEMMYSEQALKSQMTTEKNTFYIYDGKGYVSFRYEGKNDDNIDVFHLEKIYVLPEFQGQGVGQELFKTVVKIAKELSSGEVKIELNVNRHNKALTFYEHLGMHRERQGDFPIGGGFYMNDYIMALVIN